MSPANGAVTPPPAPHDSPADASPNTAKRKRTHANALPQRDIKALLEDVLEILKSYDTNPSVLDQPIRNHGDRATSGEPTSKKAKLTQPADTTIAAKVQSQGYASLDELVADVETVCAQLSPSANAQSTAPADLKLATGLLGFKKALRNLVERESQRRARSTPGDDSQDDTTDADADATNGVVKSEPTDDETADIADSKTVLTLFASAQGNKQLFSSLQKPVKVEPGQKLEAANLDTSVNVTLPLDESGLPSMISTTKVIPVHTEDAIGGKGKVPTFGELFAPPPKFRDMKAPVPSNQFTTKDSIVTWGPPEHSKASRRGSTYSSQKLSTGDWLGYNGVVIPQEPTSPSAKRKQRDRALSTGELNPPVSEEAKAAQEKAKADALFRSVFSSFAPTHDDGMAVVPEEIKNRIYWRKFGEQRFNEVFAIDPALFDAQPGEAVDEDAMQDSQTEEEAIKEAIEGFQPEEFTPKDSSIGNEDREVEEILTEISQLLETLHSHQRIRLTTLAPSTRPAAATQDNSTRPSTPSSDEFDIYNMLKMQLSLMISSLPPYAVAKLNGDQLADLNISKSLLIETEDYRGVMEEDQISKLAKSAAIGAAVGAPAVPVRAPSTLPSHHYAATASQYGRTPSVSYGARPVAGAPSYYPQQQPPTRSPSLSQYPRSSQPYQTPGAYASTARPGYAQTYAQTPSRPSYGAAASTYAPTPGHQYYPQRPGAPAYGIGHTYYQTPAGAAQSRYTAQTPGSAYPARTQGAAPVYNYTSTGSPHVRTASPLKSQPAAAGAAAYAPARPPSATAATANPYATPGANASRYYPPGTPVAGTPYTAAATGVGYAGASADMLSRTQAQAQAQAQARLQAQAQVQAQVKRQGSGTPQPPGSSGGASYGSQSQGQGQGQQGQGQSGTAVGA